MRDSDRWAESDTRDMLDAITIGAGPGSLGAAAKFIEGGCDDIVVIEAASDRGGVLRQRRHPNVACDTAIDLYAFGYYPGDKWSTDFAPGSEILTHTQEFADPFHVTPKVEFDTRIIAAHWDGDGAYRPLQSEDGQHWCARILIWAGGILSQPIIPEIEGLESFTGESVHASYWYDGIDLVGKRVAVVGGKATSVQVVPYVAKLAEKLYVFVRTPAYVVPRPDISFEDMNRKSPEFAEQQRAHRLEWLDRFEMSAKARFSMVDALVAEQEANWRKLFDAPVTDPHVRQVLTPTCRCGCKRAQFSADYYLACGRKNVEMIARGVSGLSGDCIVDAEGDRYAVDVVIWATGFAPTAMLGNLSITGTDARKLAKEWEDVPHAYFGTMVEGFPNFFLINGLNSGSASVTDLIEGQADFILEVVGRMKAEGTPVAEVSEAAYRAFNEEIQARGDASVMVQGNCNSYYRVGGGGKMSTHWPDTIVSYRRRMEEEALAGVNFSGAPDRADA